MADLERLSSLLKEAAEKREGATEELLREYATKMYYTARFYLKDRDTAKEADLEALKEVFGDLADIRAEEFENILRKKVLECSLAKLMPLKLEDPGVVLLRRRNDSIELPEADEKFQKLVLKQLDRLSDTSRAIAVLSEYEKKTPEEIASILGIKASLAESLRSAADREMIENEISPVFIKKALDALSPFKDEPVLNLDEVPEAVEETPEEEDTAEVPVMSEAETVPEEEPQPVPEEALMEEEIPAVQEEEKTYTDPLRREIRLQHEEIHEVTNALPPVTDEEDDEEEEEEERGGFPLWAKLIVLAAALCVLGFILFDTKLLGLLPGSKGSTPQPTPEITASAEPAETPEATPETTPEVPAHPEGSLGKASVNISGLRIRTGPGTDAAIVGEASNGEIFEVYEVKNDGTFDWYRVGENRWIANNGTYATYTPYGG